MITWLHDFGLCPEENVERDYRLFGGIGAYGTPVVARVNTFGKYCATTGYLSRLSLETEKRFREMAIPLLRRVSGGGIALHGEDLCFSFFFEGGSSLNNAYRHTVTGLRRIVVDILQDQTGYSLSPPKTSFGKRPESEYCLSQEDANDIFFGRQKIAGFGGRVRKNVFLVHLQVISAGWNPDLIAELAGYTVPLREEYFDLKKFVFSGGFLENIKNKLHLLFHSSVENEGQILHS